MVEPRAVRCVSSDSQGVRRHVGGALARRHLRQTEVEDLCLAALGDEEIRGFEIAVDDARTVRRIERIRDLLAERGDLLDGERLPLDRMLDRLSPQSLHHQEGLAFVHADVVDRADVRMIQRRRRARLTLEAIERMGAPAGFFRQELDRHPAAELGVLRLVDHTHPTAAELRHDGVA